MLGTIAIAVGSFILGSVYTSKKLEQDPSILLDFIHQDMEDFKTSLEETFSSNYESENEEDDPFEAAINDVCGDSC